MLTERKEQLKTQLFSYAHTLLPLVAPFFLQLSSSIYLFDRLPFFVSMSPAIGLVVSYLFGPVGFFVSLALMGSYLAIAHVELLSQSTTILFLGSCLVSWWMSTLCSEQYQQKIIDLEEMIAAIFHKNNELEKHAKDALVAIREERKEADKLRVEQEEEIQRLQGELTSHRHHLSLAWQESSSLKEEAEKERRQLMASIEGAQSQSLFYLQQKQSAETSYAEMKMQLDAVLKEKEEKQNNFLEQFRLFQEREDVMKKEDEVRQRELSSLQIQLEEVKKERDLLQEEKESLALHEDESSSLTHYEILYKQIKEQFEEKSETLSETRKHLFSVENELLVLQRKQQENLLDEDTDMSSLIETIGQLVYECQDLRQQVTVLEEIVSIVQQKKKSPRIKREANTSVDKLLTSAKQIQDSLFSL